MRIVVFIIVICAIVIVSVLYGKKTSTIQSTIAPTPERRDEQPQTVSEHRQVSEDPQVLPSMSLSNDTIAPKAYIVSPENNQRVKTPLKIVANVTDNIKVDRVEFYAGSSDYQHIGTVYQAPFEVIWTPSEGLRGYGSQVNIPVYIKAFDSSSNRSDAGIVVFFE